MYCIIVHISFFEKLIESRSRIIKEVIMRKKKITYSELKRERKTLSILRRKDRKTIRGQELQIRKLTERVRYLEGVLAGQNIQIPSFNPKKSILVIGSCTAKQKDLMEYARTEYGIQKIRFVKDSRDIENRNVKVWPNSLGAVIVGQVAKDVEFVERRYQDIVPVVICTKRTITMKTFAEALSKIIEKA